jgi:hypothetical protein
MATISDYALKQIGFKEGANNENKFSHELGRPSEAWCADFVVWCAKASGNIEVMLNSASCIEIENWGRKQNLTIPINLIKKNDLVLFDFSKSGKPEHIGISLGYNPNTHLIDTVEGNTSDSSTGSQPNGDGVYLKHRAIQSVRTVLRPKWIH